MLPLPAGSERSLNVFSRALKISAASVSKSLDRGKKLVDADPKVYQKLINYQRPGNHRIKMGNYRIGFEIINEELILTRILHRKTIYRYFP